MQVPRNVRLDAHAIWDASSHEMRTSVRDWAAGLYTHDGTPLKPEDAPKDWRPPVSDARVAYKIFALVFDISSRIFDYAGRERPKPWLSREERRSWVGRKPLQPVPQPGRQPTTSVLTDCVAVHALAEVFEPLTEQAAAAPEDVDARARALRRFRDPSGRISVATAGELHTIWQSGAPKLIAADPGPSG